MVRGATPAFDEALRTRFLTTYRAAAAAGQLTDWEATPEGALALVIVLDQFPLNLFRGQAESFTTEAAARAVANPRHRPQLRSGHAAGPAAIPVSTVHAQRNAG